MLVVEVPVIIQYYFDLSYHQGLVLLTKIPTHVNRDRGLT